MLLRCEQMKPSKEKPPAVVEQKKISKELLYALQKKHDNFQKKDRKTSNLEQHNDQERRFCASRVLQEHNKPK